MSPSADGRKRGNAERQSKAASSRRTPKIGVADHENVLYTGITHSVVTRFSMLARTTTRSIAPQATMITEQTYRMFFEAGSCLPPKGDMNSAEANEFVARFGELDYLLSDNLNLQLAAKDSAFELRIAAGHKALAEKLRLMRSSSSHQEPADTPVALDVDVGDVVGERYELQELLDSRKRCDVFLAIDTKLDRKVAIKVIDTGRSGATIVFLREAKLMAQITHPHVVRIYDYGIQDALLYIVMEYIEGDTLDQVLKTVGSLPVANAVPLMMSVTDGLAALHKHEHCVIHRDVKPSNIMIDRAGRPVLMDFGTAKTELMNLTSSTPSTVKGSFLGTPYFMAPEQFKAPDKATTAADVYSLGITFYQLLTGRLPYNGETLFELHESHLSAQAPPVHEVNPGVPVELSSLIAKMMAKEAQDRFPDAGAVAEELRNLTTLLPNRQNDQRKTPDGQSATVPGDTQNNVGSMSDAAEGGSIPRPELKSEESPSGDAFHPGGHAAHTAGADPVPFRRTSTWQLAAAVLLLISLIPTAYYAVVHRGKIRSMIAATMDRIRGDGWYSEPRIFCVIPFGDVSTEHHVMSFLSRAGCELAEREKIDQIVAELKLGRGEQADEATAVRIGKLVGAHIIVTGGLGDKAVVFLRAIHVESSKVLGISTFDPSNPDKGIEELMRSVDKQLNYRSRIASITDTNVVLGHGSRDGARVGMKVRVLDNNDNTVGLLEITQTDMASASATIVQGKEAIRDTMRVEEVKE